VNLVGDIPEEIREAFVKRYPECAGEMLVSEKTWTKLSTFYAGWAARIAYERERF